MKCNTCEQCGEQFEASRYAGKRQRFCTKQCSDTWWYENGNNEYTCQHCGDTYRAKKKDRNKYCSRECAFEAKQAKPKEIKSRIVRIARCKWCDAEFAQERTAAYCSVECSIAMRRHKDRLRDEERANPDPRPCKQCGKIFVPVYGTARRCYCSEGCVKRAQNARPKSLGARARKKLRKIYGDAWRAYYEPINARRVYRRDGWTCQLCGRKVKRTKQYHPQQATIDHVVALSRGGPHWYDNVQTACMECNITKGDGDAVLSERDAD